MTVAHGFDALGEATLERLFAYVDWAKTQACWNTNTHLWQRDIVQFSAPVLVHAVDGNFANELLYELFERGVLLADHRGETVMVYIWPAGSFIPWHTDYGDRYSLTVYLNRQWQPDHGGAFCWQDRGDEGSAAIASQAPVEGHFRSPTFNAYVRMTGAEWHCVSMTMPDAPARLTLQMFLPLPRAPVPA